MWHNLTMAGFSELVRLKPRVSTCKTYNLDNPGVILSETCTDLIDGTQYRFTFEYMDVGKNDPVFVRNEIVWFAGAGTLPPVISQPVEGQYIKEAFTLDFTLLEPAARGTVRLNISHVGGRDDPIKSRMIVFDTYAERAEQYIITMQKLSTAAANMIEIESITPAADLVDGGKYNFRLTYQDGALNPPAAFDVVNVNYAGFETMTPNITLPVSSKKVLATFDVAISNVGTTTAAAATTAMTSETYDLIGNKSISLSYASRTDTEVPCAEDVQWYFSASSSFSGNLRDAYNGRLEFFLRSPDHSGSPRSMTNFVIIDGGTGIETKTIYNNLIDFPVPSMTKWTSYVVVLREDFGWTNEKNQPLSFNDMWDVLGNVKKISIRGDNWLCSYRGDGSEAVTIQNVTLYKIERVYT
eukprot:g14919.t1